MKNYFISSKKCALLKNSSYIGVVNGNLQLLSDKISKGDLLQFLPLSSNYLPVNFVENEAKTFNDDVEIYNLKDDKIYLTNFKKAPIFKYEILYFEKLNDKVTISLMLDGYFKLSVFNENGNFTTILNIDKVADFKPIILFNLLIIKISGDKNLCYIFDILNKPVLIFADYFKDILYENDYVIINTKAKNITKTSKTVIFNGKNRQKTSEEAQRSVAIDRLSPLLLPFAFLEEFMFSCNFKDFLAPELKDKATVIKEYLGNFFTFIPFSNNDENKAILLFKQGRKAKILNFEYENSLISNFFFDE